jgi:hypothetical protein
MILAQRGFRQPKKPAALCSSALSHSDSVLPVKHWAALWLASAQWELSRPRGDGVDFNCDEREPLAAIRLASSRLETSDALSK